MQVNHFVLYEFPITNMLLLRGILSRISVKCCVLNNLVCFIWLEIVTYNSSRTTVTNKVALIVGVFCICLTCKDTKMQGVWLRAFIKRGIGIFIIYYHWKFMLLKLYIVVLAVTQKHYAKLHTSGCGHFSEKSCQLSVSSNSQTTRGKED